MARDCVGSGWRVVELVISISYLKLPADNLWFTSGDKVKVGPWLNSRSI